MASPAERIDWMQQPADAERLRRVAAQLHFDAMTLRRALQLAGATP